MGLRQKLQCISAPRWAFALALLLAVMAVLSMYARAQDNAMRRLALRAAPPPTVQIESFHPALDLAAANEVAITAQLDLARAVPIGYRTFLQRHTALLVPLLPVQPRDDRVVARGFALIPDPAAAAFAQVPERYLDLIEERPGGPLAAFGGRLKDNWSLRRTIRRELRAAGIATVPDAPIVVPFVEGRAAALLAPGPGPLSAPLLWLSALSALIGVTLQLIERRRGRDPGTSVAEPLQPMRSRRPLSAKGKERFAPLAAQNELVHPLQKPQRYGPPDTVGKLASRIRPTTPVVKERSTSERPARKSG